MRRLVRLRSGWLLSAVFIVAAVAVGVPSPAQADFAGECAAPTTILTGGSSAPLSVAAGQTVLLTSGTYTGGVNSLDAGGRICVASTATFNPPYVNNPAGSILVRGTATFAGLTVNNGFVLDNEGSVTVNNYLNTNGPAQLINRSGGTLTATTTVTLSNGSVLTNDGTANLSAGLLLNTQASLINTGTVTVAGFINNGSITNSGVITDTGDVIENSGGSITNTCQININGGMIVNDVTINSGFITVTGGFTNNGTLSQASTGLIIGADFTNDNSVAGFGRFLFSGTTRTQGQFVGTDPTAPIVFFDTSPTGPIFDVASGVVANVIRSPVSPPSEVPPGCANRPATADVVATKTGPATVAAGGAVTYVLTVTNVGPDAATGVAVTDTTPANLVNVTFAPAPNLVAGAAVTWNVGALAAGASASFQVNGTAPASGTLLDVVTAAATTPDPDPTNNDGSQPSARVTTIVVPAPPVNNPPVVSDSTVTTSANVPAFASVPFSDPDPGQTVQFTLDTPPAHGTLVLQPGGAYQYNPDLNFTGRDTFSVTGCDNGTPPLCDSGTVTIVVLPVASDLTVNTPRDTPILIDVTANDVGDTGPPTVSTPPAHGAAVVQADGTVLYTPAAGFVGSDTFDYQVCSTVSPDVCDTATVTINVLPPPNNPPVIADDAVTTPAGSPVSGQLDISDPDPGQTLTVTLTSPPSVGTAVVTPSGGFTYTPAPGFSGVVTFTATVCDNGSPPLCDTGTVTVTVTPVANPDAATTLASTPVDIDVLANDVGVVAPPVVTLAPANGTAVVQPGGTIRYTPTGGFTGTDTFTYRACSPNAATLCATATVTVSVDASPNHPPVLGDQARTTIVDIPVTGTLVGSDPDGDPLTYALASGPAHGSATVAANGAWTYTPAANFAGIDKFTATACDPAPLCATATVTITVRPVASPDAASTNVNVPVRIDVAANDRGTVSLTSVASPAHGTATVAAGVVEYGPDRDFTGIDTFGYTVCATGFPTVCDTSSVLVTVYPLAVDDAATTRAGQSVVIPVGANDVGITGPPAIITPPANGTVSPVLLALALAAPAAPSSLTGLLGTAAAVRYTPRGTFTGHDFFRYRICAPNAPNVCADAVVTVTVVPALADDLARTREGVPVVIDVAANDFGAAGPPLVLEPPAAGTVTVLADGSVRYTPLPGFTGVDSFTYRRCALSAPDVCAEATVAVVVAPTPGLHPGPSLPATGPRLQLLVLLGCAFVAAGALLLGLGYARQ
jgi:uncharacterized repeat protein (TIGR01451 family)